MQQLNRFMPALPVTAMQTYQIAAPKSTHWRKATCAEVECPNHLKGWRVVVDVATDLGQAQSYYITRTSGRQYKMNRTGQTTFEFLFYPGQSCFEEHKVRLDRQELFIVRQGDWRRRTGPIRQFDRPGHWLEHFAENQDRLKTQIERG